MIIADNIFLIILSVLLFSYLAKEVDRRSRTEESKLSPADPPVVTSDLRRFVFAVPMLITLVLSSLQAYSSWYSWRYFVEPEAPILVFDSVVDFQSFSGILNYLIRHLQYGISLPYRFLNAYQVPAIILIFIIGWKKRRGLTLVLLFSVILLSIGCAILVMEDLLPWQGRVLLETLIALPSVFLSSFILRYGLIYLKRSLNRKRIRIVTIGIRAWDGILPTFLFLFLLYGVSNTGRFYNLILSPRTFPAHKTMLFLGLLMSWFFICAAPAMIENRRRPLSQLFRETRDWLINPELLKRMVIYLMIYTIFTYIFSSLNFRADIFALIFTSTLFKNEVWVFFYGFAFIDIYGYILSTAARKR